MSDINKIAVKITGDESSLKQATSEAKKDLDSVSQSAISFGNIITGTALGSMLGGAITKAFGRLRTLMGEADESFKTSSASLTKLATIMQQRGATQQQYDDIIRLTQAEQKLGVISADAMQNGLQEMATYVGQAESLKKLTNTMNNLVVQMHGYDASAYNVMQTATMMGKVLQGQTGGMERIGYHLTEAEKALFNFGTEEERVALLIDIVDNNIGHLNRRLGETDAGKQMQLANTWADLKAQVGELASAVQSMLVPAFSAVANAVATAIGWIKAFFKLFGVKFGSAAETQAVNVDNAGDAIDNYGGSVAGAAKKIKRSLATFDEMNVLTENAASGGGGGGGGDAVDILEDLEASLDAINWSSLIPDIQLPGWVQSLKDLFSGLDMDKIRAAFSRLWQDIKEGIAPVKQVLADVFENYLKPMITWAGNDLLPAFLNALGGAIQFLGGVIGSVWEVALKPFIDSFLVPLAQWTGGTVVNVLNAIGDGLRSIAKNKKVLDAVAKGLTAIGTAIAAAKVVKFFDAIADGIKIFKTVNSATGSIVQALSGVASNTDGLVRAFSNLGGNVAQTVSNGLELLKTGFSSLWGVIKAHPIATIATALGALLLTNEDFRASLGNLLNSVITPLMTVLGQVGSVVGQIMSVLSSLLSAVITPISGIIEIIAEVLSSIVNAAAGFISLGLQIVLAPILAILELIKPVLEFIFGLVEAILTPLGKLVEWLGGLFGITKETTSATDNFNAKLDEEHQKLDNNRNGVIDYTEALDGMADAQLAASDATLARIRAEEHLADVSEKYNPVIEELKGLTSLTAEQQKELEKAEAEVENATLRLQVAQQKETEEKKKSTERTREAVNAAIENKKAIVATQLANNLASDSFDNLSDALKDAIDKNDSWTDSLGNTHKFTQAEIDKLVTKVLASADEIKNNVTYSMDRMTGNVTKILTSLTGSSYNNGYNFDSGLARGIDENAYLVIRASGSLCDEALYTVRRKLGIQSPSKVMAQQGAYIVEGLAQGIDRNAQLVTSEAQALGTAMVDAFNTAPKFRDLGSLDIADQFSELTAQAQGTLTLQNEATNGAIDQLAMAINNLANQGQQITVKIGEETLIDKVVDGINNANMMRNQSVLNL